ncbi:MAG: HNH endonuclease [Planctomycetes bacterium]|nr:HNH endonuclease [Planctomycetota bacterium]MCB9934124.1 HNH endonuclease [Planctomycetota bacterium]
MARDGFPKKVIDVLFKRAGARCCNPDCVRETFGPAKNVKRAVNVGVAAHITAASKGGPRYDSTLTSAERRSSSNGVWLCQTCGKLIDSDVDEFPTQLLKEWKRTGEERANLALRGKSVSDPKYSDDYLLSFFLQCFDRPAFQDDFHIEISLEAFDQAMEDTIVAVNTGVLRDRRGRHLQRALGKAFVRDRRLREQLDDVVDMVRGIRGLFRSAVEQGRIRPGSQHDGKTFYELTDPSLADELNLRRCEVIDLMNELGRNIGASPLTGPNGRFRHGPGFLRW